MKKPPHKSGRPGKRDSREPRVAVLYEDDAVLAIDKPAGLAAVPIKGSDMPSAWSMVAGELRRKRQRAFVVHRIDRFTSGVMLFAKTERDRDALVKQFLAHTPVRQYLAVIRGHLSAQQGKLVHHFRREGMFQELSTARDRDATKAELRYVVERKLKAASLLRVTLVTGLQNQIRVQFSAEGHPVIGDRKYHPAEADEKRIDRVALHAARLEFVHPRTGEKIVAECEAPQDFKRLVEGLGRHS